MKSAHSMPFIVLNTYVFQYRDLRDPHLQMKTHTIFEHSLAHLRTKENQAAIQKPNRKGKNDSITIQRSVSQEALFVVFFHNSCSSETETIQSLFFKIKKKTAIQ